MTPFSGRRIKYQESSTLNIHILLPFDIDQVLMPTKPASNASYSSSVSVAVTSEASSIFAASFPTDEDGYESDEDIEPPTSIIVNRPPHNSASSVKKGKRPVQPNKARSRSFLLDAPHPSQILTARIEEERSIFTIVNPESPKITPSNTSPSVVFLVNKRSLSIARCHCRGKPDLQTEKLGDRGVRLIKSRVAPGVVCMDNERWWRSRRIWKRWGSVHTGVLDHGHGSINLWAFPSRKDLCPLRLAIAEANRTCKLKDWTTEAFGQSRDVWILGQVARITNVVGSQDEFGNTGEVSTLSSTIDTGIQFPHRKDLYRQDYRD